MTDEVAGAVGRGVQARPLPASIGGVARARRSPGADPGLARW